METKTAEVRSKGEVLGNVEFAKYDSTAEAAGTLGEDNILNLINAQVETNARNEFRRLKTTGSGVSAKALKSLLSEVAPKQMEALAAAIAAKDTATVAAILGG